MRRLAFGAFAATALLASGCSFIRDFDDFSEEMCVITNPGPPEMNSCTPVEGRILQCIDGSCVPGNCMSGRRDCDMDALMTCETITALSRLHCGDCNEACDVLDFCAASTCQHMTLGLAAPANGSNTPLLAPIGASSIAIVYNYDSTLTAPGGPYTPTSGAVRVIRLNETGTLEWTVSADGANNDTAAAVTTTSDGLAIAGTYNSSSLTLNFVNDPDFSFAGPAAVSDRDGYVWAVDADGDRLWEVRISGALLTDATLIASDGDNVYVAGQFSGTQLFVGNSANLAGSLTTGIYVAKFLSNGARAWVTVLSGDSTALERLAVDPAGNVYLFSTSSTQLIAGTTTHTGANTPRLVAFNPTDGAVRWFRPYSSAEPAAEGSVGLATLSDGRVFIAFHIDANGALPTAGSQILLSRGTLIAEIDPLNGNALAAHELSDDFLPFDLQTTSVDTLVLSGRTTTSNTTIDLGGGLITLDTTTLPDLLFAGYLPNGSYQFARVYGAMGTDPTGALAVSANNRIFVSGLFSQTLTIDGTPIPPGTGIEDSYVLRFDPRPVP